MKALFITLGVVVAVVVITVIACIGIRNGLIDRDEKVREQWSQIETQLQRRADLIPNLVNTVKGYANSPVRCSRRGWISRPPNTSSRRRARRRSRNRRR